MANLDRTAGSAGIRPQWRELGRLALDSFVTGLCVSLLLGLAVFIISFEARASGGPDPTHGTLVLREDGGAATEALLVATDVHMDVTGMLARVQVSQRFRNPSQAWREGVYLFPLPEKAAVDHLAMRVGKRVIEGEIRERGEARRAYDNAKAEGRRSTLVEQERPNLFTTSVANIGPGEDVVVTIEYQETLRYVDGSFRLRFPLAVTPRYIPGLHVADAHAGAAALDAAGRIDAERISPPLLAAGDREVNPVTLSVDLNAGFALADVTSSYHDVQVEESPGHRYRLVLADGAVPANRDFELAWTPDVGSAPGAALFTETKGGSTYALLMTLPASAPAATTPRIAREVTFVVDTSGSMQGISIVQAKEALLLALERLQPGDRFNVIEFNSVTRPLFSAPMPLDAATLREAKQFVAGLRASGGTEMLPALEAAFAAASLPASLQQIVFLTDGAVGNEDAILRLVHERLGERRLFTIGIGPAPNTFFLAKAAQYGRGSFTAIGDVGEVKDRMSALFRQLEQPAITDIAIAWPGATEAWPQRLPDLYAGEPLVVAARFPAGALPAGIAITGRRGDSTWDALLPVERSANDAGVAVLWARDKIAALMDAGRQGAPEAQIREAVLDVALTHHLVSKYTSLVAVDVTPARPGGVDVVRTALPLDAPQGLTGFDRLPRTATPAPLMLVVGMMLLLAAAALALVRRRGTLPAA